LFNPSTLSRIGTPLLNVVVDFSKWLRMYLGEACKAGAPQFENGTTNGAGWYPLTGGMQVCTEKSIPFFISNAKLTFSCFFSSLGLQLYLAWVHGDHTGAVLLQVPASLRASGTSSCKFPPASELQVHLVSSSRQPWSLGAVLLQVPASLRALGTSCCKFPPASELQVHIVASSRQPQSFRYILLQVPVSLRALGSSFCKFPPALEL
jgi:hypothetical protein